MWLLNLVSILTLNYGLAKRVYYPFGPKAPTGHQLEYVAALWRHGDRAPASSFKHDLYPASYWDYGYGQLTNYGIQQHRELGKWVYNRYVTRFNFLPRTFDSNAVKIRTTFYNRTRESALYNFRGMYGDAITYDDLNIYSTTEKQQDAVGFPYFSCEYAKKLSIAGLNTKEVVEYMDKEKKLIELLKDATSSKIPILLYLGIIADSMVAEKLKGLQLAPEYEEIYDQIHGLFVQAFRFSYGYDISSQNNIDWKTELIKMQSGGLLNIVLNDMKVKDKCNGPFGFFEAVCQNPEAKEIKYRVFSMHDVNMLGILSNLGFKKLDYNRDANVDLGSALFFELWKDDSGLRRYVKIIYRRNENETYDLSEEISGCSSVEEGLGCSLDDFIERTEKYLIKDENKYCAQSLPTERDPFSMDIAFDSQFEKSLQDAINGIHAEIDSILQSF